MSQSKKSKIVVLFFVLAFLGIALFQARHHHPSSQPIYYSPEHMQIGEVDEYPGFTWDACHYYTPIIDGKKDVTNWHSSLYMYECRALLYLSKFFSPTVNGAKIQIAFYYLHLSVLLALSSVLLYLGLERCKCLALVFVPLCMSTYFMFEWMPIGLDFFFFVHMVVLCYSLTIIPQSNSKTGRVLLWAIIAITLFHSVNYRKNALLLVPFVTYFFIYAKHNVRTSNFRSFLKWAVISSIFSLFSMKVVDWSLPVTPSYPHTPMLSSDIRIAAVLRGEQEDFRETICQLGGSKQALEHPYKNSLTSYFANELQAKTGKKLIPNAYNLYIDSWRNKPGSMITSRIIQAIEFYSGGVIVHGRAFIERMFPSVANNPEAWKFARMQPSSIMYSRIIILFIGLSLVSYIIRKKIKTGSWHAPWDRPACIFCMVALIYAASFAVVPPCASPRYLAPSILIIWNTCWIWLAFTINDNKGESKTVNIK